MRIIIILGALLAQSVAAAPAYKIIDRIPGPDGGWDYVRVDPDNNRLLVARGTSVMAVDLATKAVTPGLAAGVRLHDALPINGELLVTNGGTATAVFANAKTGAIIATVPTGKGPDAATYDPQSGLVLVMDHAGGQVTLIDPKAHQAVGTIDVGGKRANIIQTLPTQISARTIAIDQRTGHLYLPAATLGPAPTPGGRAPALPGSFVVLVVAAADQSEWLPRSPY